MIQPAQPETVYVPVYDPVKVYGQSAPPAKSYYPDAYADAASSYTSSFPSGTVVPASTMAYPTTTEATTGSSNNDGTHRLRRRRPGGRPADRGHHVGRQR